MQTNFQYVDLSWDWPSFFFVRLRDGMNKWMWAPQIPRSLRQDDQNFVSWKLWSPCVFGWQTFLRMLRKQMKTRYFYLDENRRVAGLSFACFDQGKPPTDTSAFVTWNIVVGFSNKYTIHIWKQWTRQRIIFIKTTISRQPRRSFFGCMSHNGIRAWQQKLRF